MRQALFLKIYLRYQLFKQKHRVRRPVAGDLCGSSGRENQSVGAGLLAMTVGQPIQKLTDPPPSRASPLPPLMWGVLTRYKAEGFSRKCPSN